jgi:hypothetical protein
MNFNVEPAELDLIMRGLMVMPWNQVNGLINKLLTQANNQPVEQSPQSSLDLTPPGLND